MWWILHRHGLGLLSMVIDIIDIQRIAIRKAKNNPPVGSNCHRPKAFPHIFEWMKPNPGQIHILDRARGIKPREDVAKLPRMFGDHAALVVVLMKTLQALVTERPYHF